MRPRIPLEQRLATRSLEIDGHLIWQGAPNESGYGTITILEDGKRANRYVHRVAYEHWVGPIPDGWEVDHKCRIRLCIQPSCLEAVTREVNVARATAARRESGHSIVVHQPRLEVCRQGLHKLTPDNVLLENGGRTRRCKSCKNARQRLEYSSGRRDL